MISRLKWPAPFGPWIVVAEVSRIERGASMDAPARAVIVVRRIEVCIVMIVGCVGMVGDWFWGVECVVLLF